MADRRSRQSSLVGRGDARPHLSHRRRRRGSSRSHALWIRGNLGAVAGACRAARPVGCDRTARVGNGHLNRIGQVDVVVTDRHREGGGSRIVDARPVEGDGSAVRTAGGRARSGRLGASRLCFEGVGSASQVSGDSARPARVATRNARVGNGAEGIAPVALRAVGGGSTADSGWRHTSPGHWAALEERTALRHERFRRGRPEPAVAPDPPCSTQRRRSCSQLVWTSRTG